MTSVFVVHVEDHHVKPDRLEVYGTREAAIRRGQEIVKEYTHPEEGWTPAILMARTGDVVMRAMLTQDGDCLEVTQMEVKS